MNQPLITELYGMFCSDLTEHHVRVSHSQSFECNALISCSAPHVTGTPELQCVQPRSGQSPCDSHDVSPGLAAPPQLVSLHAGDCRGPLLARGPAAVCRHAGEYQGGLASHNWHLSAGQEQPGVRPLWGGVHITARPSGGAGGQEQLLLLAGRKTTCWHWPMELGWWQQVGRCWYSLCWWDFTDYQWAGNVLTI